MNCDLVLIREEPEHVLPFVYRCLICSEECRSPKRLAPIKMCPKHHPPLFKPGVELTFEGPGAELKKLFESFGLTMPCGGCMALMFQMNTWGVEGCREHKAEIVERVRSNAKGLGWIDWFHSGTRAALAGYRSIEQIVDEAIRRAREKHE